MCTSMFYFLGLFLFFSVIYTSVSHECKTPNKKQGNCLNIQQCSALMKILKERDRDSGIADYLRSFHCGFDGMIPKVCCPLSVLQPIQQSLMDEKVHQTTKPSTVSNSINDTIPFHNLIPNNTVCGISNDLKIYRGGLTELDEFTWTVLLEYQLPNGSRSFLCGGTLISKRYVLTAAHCLTGNSLPQSWKLKSVRLGEHNINTEKDCSTLDYLQAKYCSDPVIDVTVEKVITHPEYYTDGLIYHNDIALLQLSNEIQFSEFLRPACLPISRQHISAPLSGKRMTITGWGIGSNNSQSNVKLSGMILVKNITQCFPENVNNKSVCGMFGTKDDSCKGDSGGSLIRPLADGDSINWYVVGVESYRSPLCGDGKEQKPRIYTEVGSYVKWIVENLKS